MNEVGGVVEWWLWVRETNVSLNLTLFWLQESIGSNNGTGSSSNSTSGVGSSLELNQIEPVFSLAFEQIRTDIQNTCSALGISPGKTPGSISSCQDLVYLFSSYTNTVHSS